MNESGLISRELLERLYKKGKKIKEFKKNNIIANVGFNVLLAILSADYASAGKLTHMALGTGTGTPSVTDTILFAETYRNEIASSTTSGNVGIYTAFYTELEVDGVFTEFGNFIDGTGAADSGELWSKIQVSWTKTNLESLTVQCRYTFTNKV